MATKQILIHPINSDGTKDTTTILHPETEIGAVIDLEDKLNSKGSLTDVVANTAARHTHSNKSVLDTITATPISATMDYTDTTSFPTVGQLITMSLGNQTPYHGTQDLYRVLKINGTIAEVMAMYTQSLYVYWGSQSTYSGSGIDVYLNQAWYQSITPIARAAIVDNTITAYTYNYNSSVYNIDTHASSADYSTKAVLESNLTRHVYALDIEDIEEYFSNTFSNINLWTFFDNTTSYITPVSYTAFRSKCTGMAYSWHWQSPSGGISNGSMTGQSIQTRPVFQIDLTKISWN